MQGFFDRNEGFNARCFTTENVRFNAGQEILSVRKEVDIISTIKPIQTTPESSGKDATVLLEQVSSMPSTKAIQKNKMLCNILDKIRRA